jgi:cell division protein FtsB
MPETLQSAQPAPRLIERVWSHYRLNRRRIGTVAAVLSGRNGLTSWQQKRADNKSLTQEIDQLTQENARLSEHVDRLKSDPGAIEHEARARLRYARPNEIIYALPESTQTPKTAPASR